MAGEFAYRDRVPLFSYLTAAAALAPDTGTGGRVRSSYSLPLHVADSAPDNRVVQPRLPPTGRPASVRELPLLSLARWWHSLSPVLPVPRSGAALG